MNENKPDLKLVASTIKDMINDCIYSDQGTLYRKYLQKWLPEISDGYRASDAKAFRSHAGASMLGDPCVRKQWYSFHWTKNNLFDGRLIRLFSVGHLFEGNACAMLEMIGIQVLQADPITKKQYHFSLENSHAGGSLDGILRHVPMLEGDVSAEFKTHNAASFKKLVKQGVEICKPQHYIQTIAGMEMLGTNYCLYLATCKDSSDIYIEIIEANMYAARHHLEKFTEIVWSQVPPKRIADSPIAKECTFCDFVEICHRADNSNVDRSCRTCKFSYPSSHENEQSEWICNRFMCIIPKDKQLFGCKNWDIREL
jgi:CRISPR/Cas system-associated exonuclease Cas4 (RecB family)